jgi:hypothetical protein
MRKLGLVIAAVAALAVIFIGANGYACGGKSCSGKTAMAADKAGGCCGMSKGAMTGGACPMMSGKTAGMEGGCSMQKSSSTAGWASKVCDSKGYYGANVFDASSDHPMAVYKGQRFEVTDKSPFMQVAEARYYFPSEAVKVSCKEMMAQEAPAIERETVSLATMEANVVGNENGQKVAQCVVTGKRFVVTADSPVKVADGKKYYLGQTVDLSTASSIKAN